jgi:hypothetical protein
MDQPIISVIPPPSAHEYPEEGELEGSSEDESVQDPTNIPTAKKPGRPTNNQRRETTTKKDIDLGKQSTLDGHTKKESHILRNQSGSAPPKGGASKSSSK